MLAKYDITEFEIDNAGEYRYRVVIDDQGSTMIFKFHYEPTRIEIANQVDCYNLPVNRNGTT